MGCCETLVTNTEGEFAVSMENVGGEAEVYVNGSGPDPFQLRTLYSSDLSVTVTQEATRINLQVPPSTALKDYHEASNAVQSTNNTPYVTVATFAATTDFLDGETWEFQCNALICHPSGLTTVNTRLQWQIETSSGVFANLETDLNFNWPITIGAGQRSTMAQRFYEITAQMDEPRLRCRMSMSALTGAGSQVEFPRIWGIKRPSA